MVKKGYSLSLHPFYFTRKYVEKAKGKYIVTTKRRLSSTNNMRCDDDTTHRYYCSACTPCKNAYVLLFMYANMVL